MIPGWKSSPSSPLPCPWNSIRPVPSPSIIQVKKDGSTLFRGRVITDKTGWYNQRDITCEGELAFLLDSRVRPFAFTGGPAELFAELISQHNAVMENEPEKQFKVGTVTVTDPNDYINRSNTTYETTWDVLNTRLLDTSESGMRVTAYIWIIWRNWMR